MAIVDEPAQSICKKTRQGGGDRETVRQELERAQPRGADVPSKVSVSWDRRMHTATPITVVCLLVSLPTVILAGSVTPASVCSKRAKP